MATAIDVTDAVRRAVAVIVATCDAELHPEASRAWGPSLSDDGGHLSMCVEAAPGSTMARNLERGSPVGAQFTRLTSHATVQLKGRTIGTRAPTQDALDAVDEHIARFIADMAEVGVPEPTARRLIGSELLEVTIEVTERYDDTPGPGTGRRL